MRTPIFFLELENLRDKAHRIAKSAGGTRGMHLFLDTHVKWLWELNARLVPSLMIFSFAAGARTVVQGHMQVANHRFLDAINAIA